ncbi:hypothetical protein MG293_008004 [Ovis ammon polii]|uniref:Uncharacterized protein n=1 Tax=Ovis ammon polii TaxID=230172 RepID=A0AAD4UEK8_OVIAM|nr:hypothetical protein MG293_008004 [Ovis ammon polii]
MHAAGYEVCIRYISKEGNTSDNAEKTAQERHVTEATFLARIGAGCHFPFDFNRSSCPEGGRTQGRNEFILQTLLKESVHYRVPKEQTENPADSSVWQIPLLFQKQSCNTVNQTVKSEIPGVRCAS